MLTLMAALALMHAPAPDQEPVTFKFLRQSGPGDGRPAAYDPKTKAYYLKVQDIARFEIQSVVPDLEKRPVVLHITGMLDKPEGPLSLIIKNKDDNKEKSYSLYHENYDKDLFRIERKDGITTIEFLPKGKQLLQTGALFQYIDFYRN